MDITPNIQIANVTGGYVVTAVIRCECTDDECDGWIEVSSVFSDVDLMLRYIAKCVADFDSRDELHDAVEEKLRK